MFLKGEIKRSLLGCLEFSLLMRQGRNRFGSSYDEAVRSFIIPILLSPPILLVIMLYPAPELSELSRNTLALMFALRMAVINIAFLAAVWWIVGEINRREYFFQFVIANNWLSLPATLLIIPCIWLSLNGSFTWEELYPFTCVLMLYSYLFTAFMASSILRVPLELAGFITFISYIVNTHSLDIMHWLGGNVLS